MKICTRCKNMVQDNEEFCSRCGGRNFTVQGQPNQGQRPQGQQMRPQQGMNGQQGQPMQRPQMQRPQQGQPMQRPQQGQQVQRPQGMRPQQNMGGMQGQNTQMNPQNQGQQMRPQQNMQMQQNQNMGFDNGYGQAQDFNGGFDDAFSDQPMPKKKLFGKGNKQPKAPKQQPQAQQNMGQAPNFDEGNFGPAIQPINEDGSSVADWIKTLLLLLIPVYNILKCLKGMKDMSLPAYKRNYYKAFLIYFVACIAISIVMSVALGAMMGAALSGLM